MQPTPGDANREPSSPPANRQLRTLGGILLPNEGEVFFPGIPGRISIPPEGLRQDLKERIPLLPGASGAKLLKETRDHIGDQLFADARFFRVYRARG